MNQAMTTHEVKAAPPGTYVTAIYPGGQRLDCEVVLWWGRKKLHIVGTASYMDIREDLRYERPAQT
jgi:hypothetical protein